MIVPVTVVLSLSKRLNLPYSVEQQDWDIELADPDRLLEFIEIACAEELPDDERLALVMLILSSYDDYLEKEIDNENRLWNRISEVLDKDFDKYKEILQYWALENKNDYFSITPLVRNYLNNRN